MTYNRRIDFLCPLPPVVCFYFLYRGAINKVKAHIHRHSKMYSFGAGVVIAGITCVIMKGRYAGIQGVPGTAATTVFVRPFSFFSKSTVITVIQREGRGRPGFLTYCLETGQAFSSQRMAAISQGVDDAVMSLHIRGKLPDVNGFHFERLYLDEVI